jgi:hypothetical protein
MWLYNNEVIESLPDNTVGFVYLIENKINGRKYIGKKLAKFSKTKYQTKVLKNGTKKKKKIKSKVDSDWKDYYGSSIELKNDVEKLGKENFTRQILYFCKSKAECSYLEAKEQFARKVLETEEYYNNTIMCRIHGSHILSKILT